MHFLQSTCATRSAVDITATQAYRLICDDSPTGGAWWDRL
jgi:hypothetical protein